MNWELRLERREQTDRREKRGDWGEDIPYVPPLRLKPTVPAGAGGKEAGR